ncbi:protein disulfide isomerase family A, member 7, partial [Tachysurus ichikawai]
MDGWMDGGPLFCYATPCGRGTKNLKILQNGEEASAYNGPQTADAIVSYMKKQAGPSSIVLHSEFELDTFINDFDASVVGEYSSVLMFADSVSTSMLRTFLRNNIFGLWYKLLAKQGDEGGESVLSFAVANWEEFQEELEEEFGLQLSDGGEMPIISIRTRAGHKYIMQEEFT